MDRGCPVKTHWLRHQGGDGERMRKDKVLNCTGVVGGVYLGNGKRMNEDGGMEMGWK